MRERNAHLTDDDRSGRERERDSVQMSQRDMGENCYMTGWNMKIGNISPKWRQNCLSWVERNCLFSPADLVQT